MPVSIIVTCRGLCYCVATIYIKKNAKDKFFKNTLDLKLALGYII
nr:MAG TPA: hypothetical protein [Caudoviricetes sp.]